MATTKTKLEAKLDRGYDLIRLMPLIPGVGMSDFIIETVRDDITIIAPKSLHRRFETRGITAITSLKAALSLDDLGPIVLWMYSKNHNFDASRTWFSLYFKKTSNHHNVPIGDNHFRRKN